MESMDLEKNTSESMATLSQVMNKATKEGYTYSFRITAGGLTWDNEEKHFQPYDVKITNHYRFEGASDPQDNAILYLVETTGGEKGTLTESYGAYSDEYTSAFLQKVVLIDKQIKNK